MNIALILAGGSGSRFGSEIPKQYLELNGKPVLSHTLLAFCLHSQIDRVFLVCAREHEGLATAAVKAAGLPNSSVSIVYGGKTRAQSAYLGLCALEQAFSPNDLVLIHDAARPLVSGEIISNNIDCALKFGACTTAVLLRDSIIEKADSTLRLCGKALNRERLFAVQTPQSFTLSLILSGHRSCPDKLLVTDDAGILTAQGIPVHIVTGSRRNIKITDAEDLSFAKALLLIDK